MNVHFRGRSMSTAHLINMLLSELGHADRAEPSAQRLSGLSVNVQFAGWAKLILFRSIPNIDSVLYNMLLYHNRGTLLYYSCGCVSFWRFEPGGVGAWPFFLHFFQPKYIKCHSATQLTSLMWHYWIKHDILWTGFDWIMKSRLCLVGWYYVAQSVWFCTV